MPWMHCWYTCNQNSGYELSDRTEFHPKHIWIYSSGYKISVTDDPQRKQ